MATSYTYNLSAFINVISLGISINQQRLAKEIQSNVGITKTLKSITTSGSFVIITFTSSLTSAEILILGTPPTGTPNSGSIVRVHPNNSTYPPITNNVIPTVSNDESIDYYANSIWINNTIDSTRAPVTNKRVWHCVNGYKSAAEWIRCNQLLGELQNVNTTGGSSGNILSLSGNVWVPKNISSLIPAIGSIFFSAGNNSIAPGGRYYGQGSTSTSVDVALLSSFNVATSNTLLLYGTAGSIGQAINSGTLVLYVGTVATNLVINIPAGTGPVNGFVTLLASGLGTTISVYSRLTILATPSNGNWNHSSATLKIFQ